MINSDLHALLINYLRKYLKNTPDITVRRIKRNGKFGDYITVDNHIFKAESKKGMQYRELAEERKKYINMLNNFESKWKERYNFPVPEIIFDSKPRTLECGITLDREYFDSLEDEACTLNPDNKKIPGSGGRKYRSKSERDFARLYETLGFEFKYEPRIVLNGKILHPDFAVYAGPIKGMFFHEHFGGMNSSKYSRDTKWKLEEYIDNGFLIGTDLLVTFEGDAINSSMESFLNSLTALLLTRS